LNVEIVGINFASQSSYNQTFTFGRTMPWLQDTHERSVWTLWKAAYQDVRLLDARNRLRANFNLSERSLTFAENRAALRNLLLDLARAEDSDKDGLSDDWELHFFGTLDSRPEHDPDNDGVANLAEFAFGTNPAARELRTPLRLETKRSAPTALTVTFRRQAGSLYSYFLETSPDLRNWRELYAGSATTRVVRNLFDGTGSAEETVTFSQPSEEAAAVFMRVRAIPKQRP
jgi:hypothetical protein